MKSSIVRISFATLSLSLSTRRERGCVGEVGERKVEGKIGSLTLAGVTFFLSLSQKNVVVTTSDVVIISENDDSEWCFKEKQRKTKRSGSRVVVIVVVIIIIIIIIPKRAIIGETTKSFGTDSVAKIRLRGRPNETRV